MSYFILELDWHLSCLSWRYSAIQIWCHGHVMSWKHCVMNTCLHRKSYTAQYVCFKRSHVATKYDWNISWQSWRYSVIELSCHGNIMSWKHSVRKHVLSWTRYTEPYTRVFGGRISVRTIIEICHGYHRNILSCTYYVMDISCNLNIL